jgi:hypothetical protein
MEEPPLMVAVVLEDSELESSDDEFEGSDNGLDSSDDDFSDEGVSDAELDHGVESSCYTT